MPFIQDLDVKLTLTQTATAPVLVSEISKLTKTKLDVSPTMATEVLLVSVDGARLGDVLARIATASSATWQPFEGGYRLVPDRAARNIEAGAERARRVQAFRDELKAKQKAQQDQKKGQDEDSEDAAMMMGAFGMGDRIDRVVPMLDLTVLANMQDGDRVVFSSSPNRMQLALKGDVTPVVTQWIAEHNKTASQMAGAEDKIPEELQGFMSGVLGDRMKRMSQPIRATPAKVLVKVSRGGNFLLGMAGSGLQAQMTAYGPDGKVLLQESGSIGTGMLAAIAEMAKERAASKNPKTDNSQTAIQYSPIAKEFMGLQASGGLGNESLEGVKISPELKKVLFAPQTFEPLGFTTSEGLIALSKARKKPIVADIPDAAFPGGLLASAPDTVEKVAEGLKGDGAMRLVPDNDYLVIKAADPETARQTRLNRYALATILAAVADHEVPSLDELSAYALAAPAPSENGMVMRYVGLFTPNILGSISGLTSWDALRLYGSMTGPQRESLAQGGRIPISLVTPTGQAALRRLVYGAGNKLTVDRDGKPVARDMFTSAISMFMGGDSDVDVRDEPTEIAPSGLPMNGYIQADVVQDNIFRLDAGKGENYYSLGMDELALFQMFTSAKNEEIANAMPKLPDSARVGQRRSWTIRAYISENVYAMQSLVDDSVSKNAERVNLNSLPSGYQAKVAAKLEQLKKSPFGSIAAMGAFGRGSAQP